MDLLYARDTEELVYAQRHKLLYQERQFGRLPVFGLAYCCNAAPYDRMLFLSYLKLRRATIKFEYGNLTDARGQLYLGWINQEFYVVPKKLLSLLYVVVP